MPLRDDREANGGRIRVDVNVQSDYSRYDRRHIEEFLSRDVQMRLQEALQMRDRVLGVPPFAPREAPYDFVDEIEIRIHFLEAGEPVATHR